jgi:hypothetical protein
MVSRHRNGCFVFGSDSENECRDTLAPTDSAPDEREAIANSMAATIIQSDLSAFALVSRGIGAQPQNTGTDNTPTSISQPENAVLSSKLSNGLEIQRSAGIRLKAGDCDSKLPLYVVSGSVRSKDHTPRLFNDIVQIKRKPIATSRKALSSDQQGISIGSSLKETGMVTAKVRDGGNESGHEFDDLYEA